MKYVVKGCFLPQHNAEGAVSLNACVCTSPALVGVSVTHGN